MEVFIKGQKIGGIQEIKFNEDNVKEIKVPSLLGKEVSFTATNVKSNIKLMSDRTRLWCKQINWNGNVYW